MSNTFVALGAWKHFLGSTARERDRGEVETCGRVLCSKPWAVENFLNHRKREFSGWSGNKSGAI
jgi:hypothetical protein